MTQINFKQHIGLIIFIGLFTCFSAKAQQNPTPEMLYGTWVFNDASSISNMDVTIQQDLQGSAELQQHVANFYTGRQMFFGQDGTFSIGFANGMQFSGQWSLQGNNLTTLTNGAPQATQLVVFTDNQNFYLVASDYTDPNAKLLFSQVHFTKN